MKNATLLYRFLGIITLLVLFLSPGTSSLAQTDTVAPSIAISVDGIPYVAWRDESSGDDEIYVRRWNGSRWEEVGSGSASGGGISNNSGNSRNPSIAIAAGGVPYVAWGDYEIYVRRWTGSSWEEVGSGSVTGGGISNSGYLSHFNTSCAK